MRERFATLRRAIDDLTKDTRWVYDRDVQARLTEATQEVSELQKKLFGIGAGVRDSNP